MPSSILERPEEGFPPAAGSGLAARALPGWMDREEAIRFLMEDCLFSTSLSWRSAEAIWESRKEIVAGLPPEEPPFSLRKLPLSEADLKATRKFRSRHPDAGSVVDFVKLNPMDLVVQRLWISTTIAGGYRERVTPDKWLQTALLDPPVNPRLNWRHEGGTVLFDLPHSEYFLAGPRQTDGQIRVSEAERFVIAALHAGRALLLRGHHRTFACAQGALEAVNAPRGVLFGVASPEAMGGRTDEILRILEGPRPPRLGDFFDERLYLPVTLRRRRYRMQIRYEVTEVNRSEVNGEDAQTSHSENGTFTLAPQNGLRSGDREGAAGRPRAPGNAQQIHTEAVKHYQAGRIDDAVALYEQALFLKPDYTAAHINLGVALVEQGRIDEAVAHYERALVLDPDAVDVLNNLGTARATQGKMEEAAVHYRHVLASDPNNAEAHSGLGSISKFRGQFDDAMAHYDRAIAIAPNYAEAHVNRVDIKSFHPGDPDLETLESLAGSPGLSARKRLDIHFALAKALEDCGDYTRAFEHLRKGNDLKRGQIHYDEAAVDKLFQRVAGLFDSSLFERFEGEGDPSPVPVFVLGMPRSGSTLIEQILASHPQVYAAGELTDLDTATRNVVGAGGRPVPFPEFVPALDGAALRRIGQGYLARLPGLADGQCRIVDKMPANFLKIGLIRLILPNARIIHTMRDPVDTCVSCYSKPFTYGQEFTYDLAELGRYYRRYAQLMAHWRSVLPPGAMLDVSYEEVVDDLEGQARRLIDYCGLPWDDRCIDFHKSKRPVRTASAVQVRQPLFRSSLQRWRKYESGLGPLLRELGDLIPGPEASIHS